MAQFNALPNSPAVAAPRCCHPPRSLASPAWRISSGVDNFHRSHLQQASTHSRETARTLRQGKLHWDQPPENVLIVKKVRLQTAVHRPPLAAAPRC